MKSFKGIFAMLLLMAFAFVSYASDKAPPIEKAKSHFTISQKITKHDAGASQVNYEAVMPNAMWIPKADGYISIWSIGKPTGQLHESLIYKNSVSLQQLKFNRLKNSK